MTRSTPSSPLRTVRRVVRHLRRQGSESTGSAAEIAALEAGGGEVVEALRRVLAAAAGDDLAATVRLIRILGQHGLADDVADTVLRRAAPFEAKAEAVELLRESGVEVPPPVETALELARDFLTQPQEATLSQVAALGEAWRLPILERWLAAPAGTPAPLLLRAGQIEPQLLPAVIACLGDSADADAVAPLQQFAEDSDKGLRKAARRALHRLRAAGVQVQESDGGGGAFSLQIAPDTVREARAFVTGVDGAGARIVWVLTPSATAGDRLLEAVIDDTHGLRKAEIMTVTRSGFRAHLQKLQANPAMLVTQADVGHVVALLNGGTELSLAAGEQLPADYLQWRDGVAAALFEAPDTPARAAIYSHVQLDEVAGNRDLLKDSVSLLGEPFFGNWALTGEAAERAARGVRDAETSKLVVDEEQRKQQVDHAMRGAGAAFDNTARKGYRARLEEMAAVLWSAKQRDQARLALAAALGFTEVTDLYSDHPFARALIQRGVLVAYQALREGEASDESDSPIIRP